MYSLSAVIGTCKIFSMRIFIKKIKNFRQNMNLIFNLVVTILYKTLFEATGRTISMAGFTDFMFLLGTVTIFQLRSNDNNVPGYVHFCQLPYLIKSIAGLPNHRSISWT